MYRKHNLAILFRRRNTIAQLCHISSTSLHDFPLPATMRITTKIVDQLFPLRLFEGKLSTRDNKNITFPDEEKATIRTSASQYTGYMQYSLNTGFPSENPYTMSTRLDSLQGICIQYFKV